MNPKSTALPLLTSLLLAALASACSSPPAAHALPQAQFVLLGEVHDNPLHHQARAELLRELLADGKPSTVVFEQLGRQADPALARSQAQAPLDSEALITAAGLDQKGWRWPLHKPLFDAALSAGAQVRGGNLEKDEARRLVREGEAAWPADLPRPVGWSESQQQALLTSLQDGHCGAMPARLMPGMALAQRARDAAMAQAMLQARAAGAQRVILIAGNGHVRKDWGVPHALRSAGVAPAQILSRAYLEAPAAAASPAFDQQLLTPAATREDPCLAFTSPPPQQQPK